MLHVNEDVQTTLNGITDKLCVQELQETLNTAPKELFLTENNVFNDMQVNGYSDEALHEKCHIFEAKTEISSNYNFHGLQKESPEKKSDVNEFNSLNFQSDVHDNHKTGELIQTEKEFLFKDDEPLDKTIDEAIERYETDYEEKARKLNDVSVQTIYYLPETTDKQCQCDLSDSSSAIFIEGSLPKKIKLNSYGYSSAHWDSGSFELQQEGSETILVPQSLSSGTYSKLVLLLSENLAWKTVAESFGIFSADDICTLMKNKQPAEKLLSELGARLCTVDILCEVLKECQLYNILMLFRGSEPIKIVEQSYASGDNNTQMVIRGQSITLTAKAVGIPPPTYQWYHDNIELLDKTDTVLVVPHFDLDCEGEYYCLIHQEGGDTISSNPVLLTLAPERPVIIKQPFSQEVCPVGSKVTLFVKAKGHPELNYQWYKGNQQLDGCTSPTLVVDVKLENEDSKYRCYIHNSSGEVWSNECVVTAYTTPHPEPSAKLALLIANQLYDNLNRLFTPENDVKTLADLLQDLGFLVISLQNLNLIEMRNAIKAFSKLLPADAYVVFYFAGHGFEIQDKFMLPVDTPGPEDYRQTNAICERELLKGILSTNPKLFLQLLDMCLKPPSSLNKKIFQETTDLYEYEANNNLIQGYSTTSYLGAYEKKTAKNGLYVEHLKRYLRKDRDLPVVEILQKVAKDVAAACKKQKPFFGTNVTMDYRLTDHCRSNPSIKKKFSELTAVPGDTILKFTRVCVDSRVSFLPYLDVFQNTLEIRFTNLDDYRVTCETEGEELSFELTRDRNVLIIKVMNLQRLVTNKTLTLSLTKKDELVDCALLDLGKPMIAVADLWWNSDLRRREDEN